MIIDGERSVADPKVLARTKADILARLGRKAEAAVALESAAKVEGRSCGSSRGRARLMPATASAQETRVAQPLFREAVGHLTRAVSGSARGAAGLPFPARACDRPLQDRRSETPLSPRGRPRRTLADIGKGLEMDRVRGRRTSILAARWRPIARRSGSTRRAPRLTPTSASLSRRGASRRRRSRSSARRSGSTPGMPRHTTSSRSVSRDWVDKRRRSPSSRGDPAQPRGCLGAPISVSVWRTGQAGGGDHGVSARRSDSTPRFAGAHADLGGRAREAG